jgi:hypothetical protein
MSTQFRNADEIKDSLTELRELIMQRKKIDEYFKV